MTGEPRLRLFWAAPLPDTLKADLARWREAATALLPRASWARVESLHLTLAFLGERPEAELPALLQAGRTRIPPFGPIRVRNSGLGCFTSEARARVLWVGLEAEGALAELARSLQEAMRPFGAETERPFLPHLTLARFRTPLRLPGLPEAPAPRDFTLGEFRLYKSRTDPGGAVHVELGRIPLRVSSPPGPGIVPPASPEG